MPFMVDGEEQLGASITLRCTSSEKVKSKEDGDLAAFSVSELIRRRFFGRPIVPAENMDVVRELRRQGGQLKHLMTEAPHGEYDSAIKQPSNRWNATSLS